MSLKNRLEEMSKMCPTKKKYDLSELVTLDNFVLYNVSSKTIHDIKPLIFTVNVFV